MRLYARCLPEYYALLDGKKHEFRQIECIVIENTETKETREFLVKDVLRLDLVRADLVKKNYPKVSWDAKLPIFAIELGEEIKIEQAHVEAERKDGEKDEIFPPRRRHEY